MPFLLYSFLFCPIQRCSILKELKWTICFYSLPSQYCQNIPWPSADHSLGLNQGYPNSTLCKSLSLFQAHQLKLMYLLMVLSLAYVSSNGVPCILTNFWTILFSLFTRGGKGSVLFFHYYYYPLTCSWRKLLFW